MNEHGAMPAFSGPDFDELLGELRELSPSLEGERDWPGEQFNRLADAGILGWAIPQGFGGAGVTQFGMTRGYEVLAEACLVTTFVLTQRNGACQRIASSKNEELKRELLPRLAAGELFATVGVSHLTTSRQHWKKPAVQVRETDSGFVLSGSVPWVTGANRADYIVTGGSVVGDVSNPPVSKGKISQAENGTAGSQPAPQVLIALPTKLEGVKLLDPPRLLALNSSQTGSVELQEVKIERRYLLDGPVEGVMKRGKGGGAGSLTTSALALGHAAGILRRLQAEADKREDLLETWQPLAGERAGISADMYRLISQGSGVGSQESGVRGQESGSVPDAEAVTIETIRQRANSLVLRAANAYLAASKGAGFVQGHPAERAVREAMFFLVWSCPQPVLQAALREFACGLE